jgi:hypothetical protein
MLPRERQRPIAPKCLPPYPLSDPEVRQARAFTRVSIGAPERSVLSRLHDSSSLNATAGGVRTRPRARSPLARRRFARREPFVGIP